MYSEIENLNGNEYRIMPKNFASVTVAAPDLDNTYVMRIAKEGYQAEGFARFPDEPVKYYGDGIDLLQRSKVDSKQALIGKNGGSYLAQYIIREDDGVFLAMAWTTGVMTAYKEKDDPENTAYRVEFNLDYEDSESGGEFSTRIPANDTLLLPSVYILPYDGNTDDGANIFKAWFRDCKMIPYIRDNEELPYVQTDGDLGGPEKATDIGIESVKWEYGWWSGVRFSNPENGLILEGSWTALGEGKASPAKTPESLAEYGQKLNEYGLNFATYLLLHDTIGYDGNPTDEYSVFNSKTHPEWFTNQSTGSGGNFADLGNVECVEYLKKNIESFLKNCNVDQWRTDFHPIATTSGNENRHDAYGTDVAYWCTLGFVDIVQHLYDNVEGFKYESCSGGGQNKDLYLAQYASFFNCDDAANYLSVRASFYDSSYVIHPSQLQAPCNPDAANPNIEAYFCPVVPEPEVADGDEYDFCESMIHMGCRSTILGSPHWGSWTGKVYDEYTEYAEIYKEKVRPLVKEGELYHILPRPDGKNWDGIMYADPDSTNEIKGVVFLFKPSAEVEDVHNVVLDGLDEDTVYQLTFEDRPEQNRTATGAELMTSGIDVEIKYIGSEMIWLTEAE